MINTFRHFVLLHPSLLVAGFLIKFTVLNDFNKVAKEYMGKKNLFIYPWQKLAFPFSQFPSESACCHWSSYSSVLTQLISHTSFSLQNTSAPSLASGAFCQVTAQPPLLPTPLIFCATLDWAFFSLISKATFKHIWVSDA